MTGAAPQAPPPCVCRDVVSSAVERFSSGIAELDLVLGGGIVPGSLVLVGGEPGIGKSTLLLQVLDRVAASGRPVLLVCGEESAAQVKMRAERICRDPGGISVLAETELESRPRDRRRRRARRSSSSTRCRRCTATPSRRRRAA